MYKLIAFFVFFWYSFKTLEWCTGSLIIPRFKGSSL